MSCKVGTHMYISYLRNKRMCTFPLLPFKLTGLRAILYWENFSLHAFENTTQNFFQAVTLEVGDISLACSCCFTIRRDVSQSHMEMGS